MTEDEKLVLRTRDFWGACALIAASLFFLWQSSTIPLFDNANAGVSSADWYNSAAIVPLGIFAALLLLGVTLLVISIRAGGAARAMSAVGLGWDAAEAIRFSTIMVALFFYIFGLVPRVDFIIASALLLTALIWGYHAGDWRRMVLVMAAVALPGLYAMAVHLPQAEWGAHDDDWVTLAAFIALTAIMLAIDRANRITRFVPLVAVLVPVLLVMAMAFGFRQNVPARTGLLFSQIEYHWYVTLRPLWRE